VNLSQDVKIEILEYETREFDNFEKKLPEAGFDRIFLLP
jgi:hypothetical protein